MEQSQFQPIVNFIWSVADDLLRDVYVKRANTAMLSYP